MESIEKGIASTKFEDTTNEVRKSSTPPHDEEDVDESEDFGLC